MGDRQQPACFQDLCAAGAPLAAIARCLHVSGSCEDQLHLAQAVGRHHRDLVLREITSLPSLCLQFTGWTAAECRSAVRFMLRLENAEVVSARFDEDDHWQECDVEGLVLLRLLPRLKELNLMYLDPVAVNGLDICRSLGTLTSLVELHLYGLFNHTDDPSQEAARHHGQLTRLTWLTITYFMLDVKAVEHIAALTGLRKLDISGNMLEGANLAPLTNLTCLMMTDTSTDEQTLLHIGALRGLRHLDMSDVDGLETSFIAHLSGLVTLTNLQLSVGGIAPGGTLGPGIGKHLSHLTTLELLELAYAHLTRADAAELTKLNSMRKLSCYSCNLRPAHAQHIAKCTWLRELSLYCNTVGDEGAAHLARLTGLQHLDIAHNGIGPHGAARIATGLTTLTRLFISHNALGTEGAAHIARMTQLDTLDVEYTDIGAAGAQLLCTLPNLLDSSRAPLMKLANAGTSAL